MLRFLYEMALQLGYLHPGRMCRDLTDEELADWLAYFAEVGSPEQRDDLRAASVWQMIQIPWMALAAGLAGDKFTPGPVLEPAYPYTPSDDKTKREVYEEAVRRTNAYAEQWGLTVG